MISRLPARGRGHSLGIPRRRSNAFLIQLGPGEYACGDQAVSIPSYAAVVGAGTEVTRITGTRDQADFGVVDFDTTDNAELRSLTVNNLTAAAQVDAVGISVYNGGALLEDVVVRRVGPVATNEVALWVSSNGANTSLQVKSSEIFFGTSVRTSGSAGKTNMKVYMSLILGSIDNAGAGSLSCYGSFDASAPLPLGCLPP